MSFDVAALVAQEARRAGERDLAVRMSWGDVTDVTDPVWPLVDGAPARNVTGRELQVGQQVRLLVAGRDRLVFGLDDIPDPDPPEPVGGGWSLIWQAQSTTNIFAANIAQFDDWDSLRMVVLARGGPPPQFVTSLLVELSGFGVVTPPTVTLDEGETMSVTMEADRHMDDSWSARVHDIAPDGSVSGRAAATTSGAWMTFPSTGISPVIFPTGGAAYLSARLYGLPHTEGP